MRDRFLRQTRREYSERQRLAALAGEAVIFLAVMPLALLYLGGLLDGWFHWPKLAPPGIGAIGGGLLILSGWSMAMWSNYVQFTVGRGTPVPLMATQQLIIRPPYAYCRNPMALGAILLYLGVSVAAGSPGAAVLVFVGAAVLLTYIKVVEEREMVTRFGEGYLTYRARTPFIIPRVRRPVDAPDR